MNGAADDRRPFERVHDVERMTDVVREAVRDALRRHVQLALPIAVWRDEKVVWIPPEEIDVDFE